MVSLTSLFKCFSGKSNCSSNCKSKCFIVFGRRKKTTNEECVEDAPRSAEYSQKEEMIYSNISVDPRIYNIKIKDENLT